jgi:uncharacterized membrane protein
MTPMPDLGALGLGLFLLICVLPIVVSALFIFILLKIISAIRGSRELGDRATTAQAQGEAPPAEALPPEAAPDQAASAEAPGEQQPSKPRPSEAPPAKEGDPGQ